MIITPLGHTEFLVDIANSAGETARILVDTWLSDFAVGDLMERTTKVRLDPDKIATIDAIYISHAHCDHFDPYSLVSLYCSRQMQDEKLKIKDNNTDNLESGILNLEFPLLILPFTLRYLESLITEYLPSARVKWLDNRETLTLNGIEITGYMWPNLEITNEDDVMMIAISSDRELLFAEIDTIPDPYDEDVQKSLYKVFTRREYETTCYLASRNCLEGQIPYYDLPDSKRKAYRDQYIANQKEDMLASYEKYDYEEYAHFPNLFTLPGFTRGFIGQGIAYPRALSEDLYHLSIFPLDEIVSIENDYARNAGYEFSQKALLPGRQYRVEGGTIEQGRKECPIGFLVKNEEGRMKSNNTERIFAHGPLFPRGLSDDEIGEGKKKILEILNTRFLPYWSASPVASLRDALIKNGGTYRISVVLSSRRDPFQNPLGAKDSQNLLSEGKSDSSVSLRNDKSAEMIIFEYSTSRSGFIEVPYEEDMKIDEDYWFLDVLDFIEGRQEMYSSFWHKLDPKKIYRLWTCLGATYMNHDLNIAKYRLHFERARKGFTSSSFLEEAMSNLKTL